LIPDLIFFPDINAKSYMKYKILALSLIFFITQPVFASVAPLPPITNDTLIGAWEAVGERNKSVYRIEINKEGDSFLSYSSHGFKYRLYKLIKKDLRRGKIFLEFKEVNGHQTIIHFIGEGVAGERDGRGLIKADLIFNPDRTPLYKIIWNTSELRFLKGGSDIKRLSELAQEAEETIRFYNLKKNDKQVGINCELILAAGKGDKSTVLTLLEQGAEINGKEREGTTALMMASMKGHIEIVKTLLDHGANVNEKNKYGSTALIAAKSCQVSRYTEIVTLLLNHGADVNAKTVGGWTALMNAASSGHDTTVQTLLDHGADVNAKSAGGTALIKAADFGSDTTVQTLMDHGADVNEKDKFGQTALIMAAAGDHTSILKALLENGADANARAKNGLTALLVTGGYDTEIVKLLLDNGADVNAETPDGRTVLLSAVEGGYTETVKLLLDRGANVNARIKNSGTALMIAENKGHTEIVELLKQHGAKE